MNDHEDLDRLLYELYSLVIHIKEVDSKEDYLRKLYKYAKENQRCFFKQFNEKMEKLNNESDKMFFEQVSLTFLLNSFFIIIEILYQDGKLKPFFDEKLVSDISYRFKEIIERNKK